MKTQTAARPHAKAQWNGVLSRLPHSESATALGAQTILKVEDVTVTFSGFKALDGLNFSVASGELRVVIGPNGAGKTTLVDVITGKVRPSAGRVLFRDRDLTRMSEQRIAQLGVGRKFQTPNVFKTMTVLENLQLSLQGDRGPFSTLVGAFRRPRHDRIDEILQTTSLGHRAFQRAGLLSHGEKQWLELGMLMAQDPELLLVDEPVAGMTPRESERTGELLMALARRHTLIVIEHDMTFVRQIAKTITVLDEGRTLCEGTVDEVQNNAKVIEVYLGQDREADAAH